MDCTYSPPEVLFRGSEDHSERSMHGKVVMVTVRIMRYGYSYALRLTNPGRKAHQALVPLLCEVLRLEELKSFS
jgi:hypothetical protein